jgi:predicted AlkP superfamily phosphohydrolase/phosphomutase
MAALLAAGGFRSGEGKSMRKMLRGRRCIFSSATLILVLAGFLFMVLTLFGPVQAVHAYIGPGAGFALISSFFTLLLTSLLTFFYLFTWPVRLLIRSLMGRKSKARKNARVRRVVILGLDGMDPVLTARFMDEGSLPNFAKLRQTGVFAPLKTTYPSMSPVAWSSFMTGVDASHHNIFDFITRDPGTYQPALSSAEIGKATRMLPLGKYRLPLSKPRVKALRKSQPFWKILGDHQIFSAIIRVPITFPPEKFNGVLLSGMCVPDLKGSQGTFSFYSTRMEENGARTGGVFHPVQWEGDLIRARLHGPNNPLLEGGSELTTPFTVRVHQETDSAQIEICGQKIELKKRAFSPWLSVRFRTGLGMKLHGICRLYIREIDPHFEMYVSPIHIDPERPALPISYPLTYSIYLARLIGPYGTLGLSEDTWALNERVLDEQAFLDQAYLYFEEREKIFFEALEKTRRGLCACVFDTTDRIQHMFFRCLDESHPSNRDKEFDLYRNVIPDLYKRMDDLLGRVMEKIDEKSALIVVSDHGFTQFKRGVNLNTWLLQQGYLVLNNGKSTCGDWFEDVDWDRTRAFSLGLTGIFINRRGRESQGIVEEGEELRRLKRELVEKLTGIVDLETGEVAITDVIDTEASFSGPYLAEAPDLLISYNSGYRSSWDCAVGRVAATVFEDNTKSWSGDHCVDPRLVPGIYFSNLPITTDAPEMTDIAPTVLQLFGVEIPSYMKGRPLVP